MIELISIFGILFCGYLIGNLVGYNQGAKKVDELYRKYSK